MKVCRWPSLADEILPILHPREGGLWQGENFWLCLTTVSAQCLRRLWTLFSFIFLFLLVYRVNNRLTCVTCCRKCPTNTSTSRQTVLRLLTCKSLATTTSLGHTDIWSGYQNLTWLLLIGKICSRIKKANNEVVSEYGLTSSSTQYRSFHRQVFPVNHLLCHWLPNQNNQEREKKQNNTTQSK